MQKAPGRAQGIALVLVAALLWSTGGLGVKLLHTAALPTAGYRALFAFFAMGIVLVGSLGGARAHPPTSPLKQVALSLRRPLVWAAAVSYAVMVVCFVVSAKMTTAANAIFLQYTAPLYVALLSYPVLKERLARIDALTLGMAAVGMTLFFVGKLEAKGLWGNAIAIASAFGFAGLPVCLRRAELDAGPGAEDASTRATVAIVLGNLLATLACGPMMVVSDAPSPTDWAVLAALGVFQIALPYLLYARAVRVLPALESSLLATIEPILSPIWVFWATRERPTSWAIVGASFIVGSVVLRAVLSARQTA